MMLYVILATADYREILSATLTASCLAYVRIVNRQNSLTCSGLRIESVLYDMCRRH